MSTTPNQKDLLAKKSDLEGILKPDANDVLHLPDITITLAENGQFYLAGISKKLLTLIGNTSGNAVTLDGDAGLTFTTSGGSSTITGITNSSGNSTSLAASQSMVSAKQDALTAGTNITILNNTISATDTNTLSDLTDTAISSLADGQVLKYNATSGKWVNGTGGGGAEVILGTTAPTAAQGSNGNLYIQYDDTNNNTVTHEYVKISGAWEEIAIGGGGSSVIANPSGTATDSLSSIEIDGTIYSIEGGGGGGASLPNNYTVTADSLKIKNEAPSTGVDWIVEDDTDYFDSAASITVSTRVYQKTNAVPALGGVYTLYASGSTWTTVMFTSTDATAVAYSGNADPFGSFTYLGHTWYFSGTDYAMSGDNSSAVSGARYIGDFSQYDYSTKECCIEAAKYLIDHAGVSFEENNFTTISRPSTGYIIAGGGSAPDFSDATFKVTKQGDIYSKGNLLEDIFQKKSQELTSSQYENLTLAEKTNGTIYFINDPVPENQLIPRVSAADSHITSSGHSGWGGEDWHAFDGITGSLSGIDNAWCALEDDATPWIQYHFDTPYYFTKLEMKVYCHYGSDGKTVSMNILASNDGTNWDNISMSGTAVSVNFPYRTLSTVEFDLNNSGNTYEYIRIQGTEPFEVAYSYGCDFDEIYVYGTDQGSPVKKIYYMGKCYTNTGGGGGGSSAEEMTLAEYSELTEQQKNDGTIRFIPAGSGSEGLTAIDMTDITTYRESGSAMSVTSTSSKIDITWNGSVAIACNIDFNTPIDVTDYDSITFKVTNGSCYNNGTQAMYPRWDMMIGLRSTPFGQIINVEPTDSNWVVVADMPLSNHVYEETLDVSGLTGSYYLVVSAHGWNTTIEDITLRQGGDYPSQIKYMDKTYGIGSGSESDIVIVSRTDNTNPYAWLTPCDANGNPLKPSEVTLLSIFAEADMSGAPPYYNGLNVCVDTDGDRYCCKLYNTQDGEYVGDGVYSVDYTVAYIPNSGGFSGGGSSSHAYSTTEQKVGTWIDGSDVYEKSFEVTITQTAPIIEQDASYIDALISYDAVVKNSLGYISGVGMDASGWGFALHRNPSMQLLLYGNVSEAIGGKAYVTIRYTKVTQGQN